MTPASKGGSESTVKLAKAGLVPADANLLGEYGSFAALEAACAAFCREVNASPHRVTRRADAMSLVSFEGGYYSVHRAQYRSARLCLVFISLREIRRSVALRWSARRYT